VRAMSIGFLGPQGTFTHAALLRQSDFASSNAVAFSSIEDVLRAVAVGEVTYGIVPLENAIEGTVSATVDSLIFDHDVLIEREIVMPISLSLLASPGTALADITEVWSYPHALAQCRTFLRTLGSVEPRVAASTADAARVVSEIGGTAAAVAPSVAAEIYGLHVLATDIEDHGGNATKFVVVGQSSIPAPTGHDRTTIVCFQDADRPGSLYGILGRFAARDINLTRLESRPTKKGLGDYCFVIELEGHIADDVVGDCLADLQAHHTRIKFLGSYPVTGDVAASTRAEIGAARIEADHWLATLRSKVEPHS
jgi:prephenate dehydratase